MEVYELVEKKQSVLIKLLFVSCSVIAVVSMILTVLGATLFLLFMTISMLAAYFLYTRKYEYEYSYFDGEVRFTKIINKSSRKHIKTYTMDEVLTVAPMNDRSVYKYIHDSGIKKIDLTSGRKKDGIYAMVVKSESGYRVVKFEPGDAFLDEMCIKYRQKVIR